LWGHDVAFHPAVFVAAGSVRLLRSGDVQQAKAAWNEHFDDSERFFHDLIQGRAP
jgi:hypothetical protein